MAPNSRTWMSPTMPWPMRLTSAACPSAAAVQIRLMPTMTAGMARRACSGWMTNRPAMVTGFDWNMPSMAGCNICRMVALAIPATAAQTSDRISGVLRPDR